MDVLDLADYRTAVARLYLSGAGLTDFRKQRDELFRDHPQSPIPRGAAFDGVRYFPPDEGAVHEVTLRPEPGELEIDTGGPDGAVRYTRAGVLETPYGELSLWWIEAYGGGLFLPVRDATCGKDSYGGGRYLTDTVKGTHGRGLEPLGGDRVRLDFNYLYNPSCAYDDQWLCPLAPPENTVRTEIRAGELTYH